MHAMHVGMCLYLWLSVHVYACTRVHIPVHSCTQVHMHVHAWRVAQGCISPLHSTGPCGELPQGGGGGGRGRGALLTHDCCAPMGRWRARQIVKNIPPSDMAQIKAKVAAMENLHGLRPDWGCQRSWARDYLSSVSTTQGHH